MNRNDEKTSGTDIRRDGGAQADGSSAARGGPEQVDTGIDVASIGENVPLLEGIRTARAIRRLRPDPVPRALIRKVCEAGTFAPSGGNRQPWVFVAVDDPAMRQWVADRYRPIFQDYIREPLARAESEDFPAHLRRNMTAALHLAEHLHEAPVLLFIAGWKRRGEDQLQALYPCAQNVLLACRAVGLGASFTTLHRFFGEECDRLLGLPPELPSAVMLPIGWPVGRHGVPPRAPVDGKLFWNEFDQSAIPEKRPIR